jgi:hypothetical protein
MAHNANDFLFDDDLPISSGSGEVTVQELTWALIDEQIESGELQLLESLLLSDDAARHEYINCVQLHTDLFAHFAKPAEKADKSKSTVLSCLSEGIVPFDAQPSEQ